MYEIDPRKARTDLWDVGEPGAYVFDTSSIQKGLSDIADRRQKKELAQQKRQDELEKDAISKIGDLNDGSIFARDQELFAKRRNELVDYTKQNIQRLRKGDSDAWLGFHKMYGDIATEMNLSEQAKIQAAKVLQKPLDQMDEEDVANFSKWAETPGDYDFTKINVSPRVDISTVVNKELLPTAIKMADDYTGQGREFKQEDAEALIGQKLQDPLFARQSNRDFIRATDKELSELGLDRNTATAADYVKKKYAWNLVMRDKEKPRAAGGSGSGGAKKVDYYITTTADGKQRAELFVGSKALANFPETIEDPSDPTMAMTIKPMYLELDPKSNKIELIAADQDGNIQKFPYDKALKTIFKNYRLDDPYAAFGVTPKKTVVVKDGVPTDKSKQEKLTDRQNKALSAFEAQYKRKPSESEKKKILEKYK